MEHHVILEYFKYLTNPATKSAKKLGQLRETIAMESRYNRSQKQWSSHLDNTKSLIEESSKQIKDPNEVIVLGSGLLLDVPIDFLASHFKRVILVDVVHLKSIYTKTKQYKNIILIEHDVTGLSEQLINTKQRTHIQAKSSIPHLSEKTSLIISTNMLSQLHLSPIKYVKATLNYDEKNQNELTLNIMQSHINMLTSTNCQICLITDYLRNYHNEKSNITEQEEALPNLSLPKPDKKWFWEIAPKGEFNNDVSLTSEVYGYLNFKTTN